MGPRCTVHVALKRFSFVTSVIFYVTPERWVNMKPLRLQTQQHLSENGNKTNIKNSFKVLVFFFLLKQSTDVTWIMPAGNSLTSASISWGCAEEHKEHQACLSCLFRFQMLLIMCWFWVYKSPQLIDADVGAPGHARCQVQHGQLTPFSPPFWCVCACICVCVCDQEPHTFTVLISLHLMLKYHLKPHSRVVQAKKTDRKTHIFKFISC